MPLNRKETRIVPGVNVQWPWSQLIVEGKKSVETRGYPLPAKYINVPMALIQTPGHESGHPSNASIVAIVVFSRCFQYSTEEAWLKDIRRHLVPPDHNSFKFFQENEKWGWEIKSIEPHSAPAPKRKGIVFTKNCKI